MPLPRDRSFYHVDIDGFPSSSWRVQQQNGHFADEGKKCSYKERSRVAPRRSFKS